MVEINKNHVRVKAYGAGKRISIPAHIVRKLDLKHDDLIDLSDLKKVVVKNHSL